MSHLESRHNINNKPYCRHLEKMAKKVVCNGVFFVVISRFVSLLPLFPRPFLLLPSLLGAVIWPGLSRRSLQANYELFQKVASNCKSCYGFMLPSTFIETSHSGHTAGK